MKTPESAPPRTDKIHEIKTGGIVVPVSIYPDIVKNEIDNRREKTQLPYRAGSRTRRNRRELIIPACWKLQSKKL
jgi:hypothetical protein